MDTYHQIIDLYLQYRSVNAVKNIVGDAASKIRIQRVLITEGLWSSKTSEAVGELYVQGKSSQEIADLLYMSVKNVQSYLPYTRGFYGEKESEFSMASKHYRQRNSLAQQRMALKKKEKDYEERRKG